MVIITKALTFLFILMFFILCKDQSIVVLHKLKEAYPLSSIPAPLFLPIKINSNLTNQIKFSITISKIIQVRRGNKYGILECTTIGK